jgi:phosphoglycolate phosphatase
MSTWQTLIFDYDGTLANSLSQHVQIYNYLAPEYGRPPLSPAEIPALQQLSLRQFLQYQGIRLWQVPGLLQKARHIEQTHNLQPEIFPHLAKVISQLADHYQLGILTSNTVDNVETFLHAYQLSQHFSWVYAEKNLFGKHQKLRKLLRQHHLDPQTTLYIGDEVRDIEASHQAGIAVLAVTWGFNSFEALQAARPHAIVHTPQELADLLVSPQT